MKLKRVVSEEVYESKYARWGQGTRILKLECGHTSARKTSVPVPKKVRCQDCR